MLDKTNMLTLSTVPFLFDIHKQHTGSPSMSRGPMHVRLNHSDCVFPEETARMQKSHSERVGKTTEISFYPDPVLSVNLSACIH